MFIKPKVDLEDPRQNEFVQDYLATFNTRYNAATDVESPADYQVLESAIEQIQEIYHPQPWAPNKQQLITAMEVVSWVATMTADSDQSIHRDIFNALELAYAVISATAKHSPPINPVENPTNPMP